MPATLNDVPQALAEPPLRQHVHEVKYGSLYKSKMTERFPSNADADRRPKRLSVIEIGHRFPARRRLRARRAIKIRMSSGFRL
jgi:hypothetical protein